MHKLDAREIREMYEVRCALECAAARWAAVRRTPAQAKAIQQANRASKSVLKSKPAGFKPAEFTPASERVHGLIVEAANNQRLAREIDRTRLIYFSRPIAELYTRSELEESIAEHEAVARAVTDSDPDAADAAMRLHLEHALDHVLRKLAWLG